MRAERAPVHVVRKPGPTGAGSWLRTNGTSLEVPWQSHEDLEECEVDQRAASVQLDPLKHLKNRVEGGL